ncbi:GNAT family N-acetyltransferase, partial [Lactococcus petauri]|uniref:GNAT family N-acetyltransferase n=1 Tax=Lactococcus petauri TaxID=1940789 RepID=UPI0034DB5BA6|nr:N-acetyltransferase [Lactococcus petauri]
MAIYAPHVTHSASSFEEEVPTIEEMKARIERSIEKWAWLIAAVDNVVLGYAYAVAHRAREGYRFS